MSEDSTVDSEKPEGWTATLNGVTYPLEFDFLETDGDFSEWVAHFPAPDGNTGDERFTYSPGTQPEGVIATIKYLPGIPYPEPISRG